MVPAVDDAVADLPREELALEEVGAGAVPLVGAVAAVLDQVAPRGLGDALARLATELGLALTCCG